MGFLTRLLLGNGTLRPELRAELESEGILLLEEGLVGRISYKHFKAPGRRHHGKVTPVGIGLAASEKRLVAYCRSGRAELIDSPFGSPRLDALDISLEGDDTVALHVDYSRIESPEVSGEITIRAKTPNAPAIVERLQERLGPRPLS